MSTAETQDPEQIGHDEKRASVLLQSRCGFQRPSYITMRRALSAVRVSNGERRPSALEVAIQLGCKDGYQMMRRRDSE